MFYTPKSIKRIVSISAAALCMLSSIRIAPMSVQETEAADNIMTAFEITENMQLGWNLGNTFDAYNGKFETMGLDAETCWGNPETTNEMLDAVKAKGFSTIRIPVTWFQHVDKTQNYKIDEAWLARVKEIVDYCYNKGFYVILNMHHEEGWQNSATLGNDYERIKPFVTSVWTQLADTFSDYDQHLVFESMNEPRATGTTHEWWGPTQEECDTINKLNADVVKIVRNSDSPYKDTRLIMLPSYCASSDTSIMSKNVIPEGDAYLAASVHAYSPYNFTMNAEVQDHSQFTAAYKNELVGCLDGIRKTFSEKDIPVVIGEFSSSNFDNLDARVSWAEAYASTAKAYGFPCVLWDNNVITDPKPENKGECHGYLDRENLTWYKESEPVIDKLLEVFNDPSTKWGSQQKPAKIEHEDLSAGTVLYQGPAELDEKWGDAAHNFKNSVGIDTDWSKLDDKDIAVKFSDGGVPSVAISNGEWGNWTEVNAYDVDEEKGIAYYSMAQLKEKWDGDINDVAHFSVRTNDHNIIEQAVIIKAADLSEIPEDKTKKFDLDLSSRSDSDQVLYVTFTGAPGSAIEGCVGYMGEEWTNITFKDKIGADGKYQFQVALGSGENAIPAGVTYAQAQIWWCDDEEGTMSGYEIFGLGVPPVPPTPDVVWGDANCNGEVKLNDAILIMQAIGNPDVYGENGSDASHITTDGLKNADVYENGSGLTNQDALQIQKYLIKFLPTLNPTK